MGQESQRLLENEQSIMHHIDGYDFIHFSWNYRHIFSRSKMSLVSSVKFSDIFLHHTRLWICNLFKFSKSVGNMFKGYSHFENFLKILTFRLENAQISDLLIHFLILRFALKFQTSIHQGARVSGQSIWGTMACLSPKLLIQNVLEVTFYAFFSSSKVTNIRCYLYIHMYQ